MNVPSGRRDLEAGKRNSVRRLVDPASMMPDVAHRSSLKYLSEMNAKIVSGFDINEF
jgi:hypothetical protein